MKRNLYRSSLIIPLCLLIGGLLDGAVLTREGLWVDEVFSLAMATGHSLEHPASQANPSLGDFQEPHAAVDPSYFRRYIEHENPPASLSRIVRGVLISDTTPPFYYLLLHFWTRWFGTSDAALRLLSVLFGLACIPMLWSLGRLYGGRRTAAFACVAFSLSPIAVYYSVEGRMYSLIWLQVLAMVWFILNLRRNGLHKIYAPLLIFTSAAGLLTHYYFAFIFVAFVCWVLMDPGHVNRIQWLALFFCVTLLIAPWYAYVPESFGNWRVTKDWLRQPMHLEQALKAPFYLVWHLVSPSVSWRYRRLINLFIGLAIVSAILLLNKRRLHLRKNIVADGSQLPHRKWFHGRLWPWIWVLAASLGPCVQDLILNTRAASVYRYALSGFPVTQLLIGHWIARLKPGWRKLCLVLLLSGYVTGTWALWYAPHRVRRHFRELAVQISLSAQPGDIVILHSIPSGVIGFARYLTIPIPMTSWVGQLKQRKVPEDINRLVQGHTRVALLKIHYVGESAPEEHWLRENMQLVEEKSTHDFNVFIFKPR